MSELGFMLLVGLVFVGLVIPALTLLSKALLILVRRTCKSAADFDSPVTYLLLVGPVLLPLVWFISSQLHLTEPGQALACHIYDHFVDEPCWEALLAGFGALLVLLSAIYLTLRQASSVRCEALHSTNPSVQDRLDRICASHTILAPLRSRIRAIEPTEQHQLYTRGLLRRHIDINETLLNRLDDKACHGALLHELQHLRVFDPLRYVLLVVCTWLNPLGFILLPDMARWRHARELVCDRDAVVAGADPLALAQALLAAARPQRRPRSIVGGAALTGSEEMRWLKVRVGLLTSYAHTQPTPPRRLFLRLLVVATVLILGLGPHWLDAWPLVGLHLGLEDLLAFLTTL